VGAGASFILAVVSKVLFNNTLVTLFGEVKTKSLLSFTDTCLLAAIAFILLDLAKTCKK
jgi:hypothetical protein